MDFEGKTAIVAGGASGIGLAVARALFARKARVIIGDVNRDGAVDAANTIDPTGEEAAAFRLDLNDHQSIPDFLARAEKFGGTPDILVNSAGVGSAEDFFDVSPEEWDRVMNVNLKGPFFLSQKVSALMAREKRGRIVNLASASGFTPSTRAMVAYDTSKAAVIMLTKVMALQLASHGITVNAVAPGPVVTPMLQKFFPDKAVLEKGVEGIPIGRLAQPEDVVGAIIFFCSDESAYITGTTLPVEGGNLLVKHIVYGVD